MKNSKRKNVVKAWVFLLFFAALFAGCSKDDVEDKAMSEEVIEEELEPKIGLKFFGEKASSDGGSRIFKTPSGFLSFETRNDYYHGASTGDSDWVIRKLDDSLSLVEEYVLDIESFDDLVDVVRIDNESFAAIGSFSISSPYESKSFPVIKILNTEGEVLNSLVIGVPQTSGGSNNGKLKSVFYKNSVLYLAVDIDGNQTSVVALDLSLSLLWSNLYEGSRYSYVTADEGYVYFVNNYYNSNDYLYNSLSLRKLNKDNGEEVYVKTYENIEGDFNYEFGIKKIIHDQDYLYLAGEGGRDVKHSIGAIPQGIVVKVDKITGLEENRLFFTDFWYLSDVEFVGNDLVISGWTSGSFIRIRRIDTEGKTIWEYEYNHGNNDTVRDIGVLSNEGVYFTGSVDMGTPPDSDVVIGILNSEGVIE